MTTIASKLVFKADFTDLGHVIDLAKRLGKGYTVYKHPDRPNFNITHTSRTDLYRPEWVKFQA